VQAAVDAEGKGGAGGVEAGGGALARALDFFADVDAEGEKMYRASDREAQEGGESVDASAGFAGAADAGAVVQEIAAGRCGEIREGYSDDG